MVMVEAYLACQIMVGMQKHAPPGAFSGGTRFCASRPAKDHSYFTTNSDSSGKRFMLSLPRIPLRGLGIVKPAVIDREFSAAMVGIDLDNAFPETEISPGVILMSLHRGGNNRVDPNYRSNQSHAATLQRLGRSPKKRTTLVNHMPEGKSGGKSGEPIKLQLQVIEVTEITTFA
jgi:hypothetical protein